MTHRAYARIAGFTFLEGPMTYLVWLPMFVFEVWLALRLILKGIDTPPIRSEQPS